MADGSTRSKPGVSISIDGSGIGVTDPDGQLVAISDIIPNSRNVVAVPPAHTVTVEQNSSGYSIVLEYEYKVISKPPPPLRLGIVNESEQPISNVEIWRYLEDDGNGSSSSNEMQFELAGNAGPGHVTVKLNGQDVRIRYQLDGRKLRILFQKQLILAKGDSLSIKTSVASRK